MTKLDPAHVDAWTSAMLDLPPYITDEEYPDMVPIAAFQSVGTEEGVGLRLKAIDGRIVDVYLNPVLAREIISHIVKLGRNADWMRADFDLNT